MSSGRGGSGNIQPSTSDLETHPLTASILSQHSATQAQYEQRVRNTHAESNVVVSHLRHCPATCIADTMLCVALIRAGRVWQYF